MPTLRRAPGRWGREPRREIGLSFETGSRCEDCGVLNAAPSGGPLAEVFQGPDYLYYLLRGDHAGVPPGVVLGAMRKNAPVPRGDGM